MAESRTCLRCEEMDQCARCGSSLYWKDCPTCVACMTLDPHCPECDGSRSVSFCMSTYQWCQAHPLPGREDTERHTVELVTVPCSDCVERTEGSDE